MPQSNGIDCLKRMEFEFQGTSYPFALNPEEYSITEPNRINVTQTKRGAWVDDFGGGIKKITIKGTTGFKDANGDPRHGYNKFVELRNMIRDYYEKQDPGVAVTEENELIFWNYTDNDYWVTTPVVFELKRSISRPLLYLYNIELVCLRKASDPLAKSSNRAFGHALGMVEVMEQ